MREHLQPLAGQRLTFTGIFTRFGLRPHFNDLYLQRVLPQQVTMADGALAADHIWLPCGERLAVLDLHRGDRLTFQVRVTRYHKGQVYRHKNGKLKRIESFLDYKLTYPTRILHEPAIAPTPTWTPLPARMVDWTAEHRLRSANFAAATRRYRRAPEGIAQRRLAHLLRTINPRAGRLYVCDQAEGVQHLVTAAFPDTDAVTQALVVARRYANGTATDKERLAAQHTLRPLLEQCDDTQPRHYSPPECALDAALCKETPRIIEWSACWAYIAVHGKDDRYAFHREPIAALEGLAR